MDTEACCCAAAPAVAMRLQGLEGVRGKHNGVAYVVRDDGLPRCLLQEALHGLEVSDPLEGHERGVEVHGELAQPRVACCRLRALQALAAECGRVEDE
eukprot:3781947-Rhodomonas_salina.1